MQIEFTIEDGKLSVIDAVKVPRSARAGLRIAERKVNGDWSILWLRKRSGARVRASRPGALPEWSRKW